MSDSRKYNRNLKTNGWTRRFAACEPRLSEAVELYREAGFEVLLEKPSSEKFRIGRSKNEEKYECLECCNGSEQRYRTIYTRPKKRAS